MKIFYFSIISLIGLGVLSGCKDSGSAIGTNVSVQEIFPMKIGSRWTYNFQSFNSSGVKMSDTLLDVAVEVQDTYVGHQGYLLSTGDVKHLIFYYYDGTTDLFKSEDNNGKSELFLHTPMTVDQELVLKDTTLFGVRQKSILVFRSANESVTVPSGSFICMHYDRIELSGVSVADTLSQAKMYFSTGIGLIEEKDTQWLNGKVLYTASQTLVSYKLN